MFKTYTTKNRTSLSNLANTAAIHSFDRWMDITECYD